MNPSVGRSKLGEGHANRGVWLKMWENLLVEILLESRCWELLPAHGETLAGCSPPALGDRGAS